MTRLSLVSPSAQIGGMPDIDLLVDKYPLPDGIDDTTMNMEEVAGAFGVSANTVAKWEKETPGMPVLVQGGNGRAYEIRLSQVWAWRQWKEESELDRQNRVQASVAQMQMHFLNLDTDGSAPVMTAKDRREIAQADLEWAKAKRLRGELVHVDDVIDLIEDVFKTIRTGLEAMPDDLEAKLALKPQQVEVVREITDQTLTALADKIDASHVTTAEMDDDDQRDARLLI